MLVGAIAYVGGDAAGEVGLVLGLVVGGIASLAYAPIMLARTNGQTVGHRVVDTRIVYVNGQPMTGGRGFVREILVKAILFDGIGGLIWIPTLLNYLWPLWDDNNEALHDKVCGTRVVQT
jgi:uncharacterized RDD family membrane protein YckC